IVKKLFAELKAFIIRHSDKAYKMMTIDNATLAALARQNLGSMATKEGVSDSSYSGIKHSFIGKYAENWSAERAAQAEKMENEGKSRGEIWKETMSYRGKDGKWRQEVDDNSLLLKKPYPHKGQKWGSIRSELISKGIFSTVGSLMSLPTLFKAYPALSSINVGTKTGLGATYTRAGGAGLPRTIDIGEDESMHSIASIVLHELQHVIQEIEGFSRGGNIDEFKNASKFKKLLEEQRYGLAESVGYNEWEFDLMTKKPSKYQELLDEGRSDYSLLPLYNEFAANLNDAEKSFFPYRMAKYDNQIKKSESEASGNPRKNYERLAGEVESRNVQSREEMTAEERRRNPPWKTQDTKDAAQLIIPQGRPISVSYDADSNNLLHSKQPATGSNGKFDAKKNNIRFSRSTPEQYAKDI
ncbi:MAG: LPD23 domain-containing protein, partial [Ghiorsea sp.]